MNIVGISTKAVILNNQSQILTIRRSKTVPIRPLTWDFPGGELEFGEDATVGIIKEIKEETGLEVTNITPFDVESHINRDGDFWVTIAFQTQISSPNITLSYEYDNFKWVSKTEFLKLESVDKLKRFIRNLPL